jgi:hypothetical protein
MKKTILTAIGTVLGLVLVVGVLALLLMLLMNAAFPLLAFGFWQALALLGIALIVGLPAMKS